MDLLLSLIAKDEASKVFGEFSGVVVGASKALNDMMRAAADAERVERQLKSVAGEMTDTFKAQAKAMSEQLAVEDELVMSMQTMLLRYGSAPSQIDATTRAVLDYSAATGKDANSATEALLKAVQNGTGSVKALGIQYEVTGDFTKDLTAATAELARKFGGAAANDAESVSGTARAAKIAMGELQESFGGLVNDFIVKTGVVQALSRSFRQLQEDLFGHDKDFWEQRGALMKERTTIEAALKDYAPDDQLRPGQKTRAEVVSRLKEINAELEKMDASPAAAGVGLSNQSLPGFEGKVKTPGGKSSGGKAGGEATPNYMEVEAERNARAREKAEEEIRKYEVELTKQAERDATRALKKMERDERDFEKREEQLARDIALMEKREDSERKRRERVEKEHADRMERENQARIERWAQFGLQAGQVLMNGILSAMKGSKEGEGPDIGQIAADTVWGIFGSVFSLFGMGSVFSAVSGAKDSASANFHTGGWPQRYHTGSLMPGEVPAILQSGERVLSRSEVASMGGRHGVEGAVRGGGGRGMNITIQAVDARSVQELFSSRSGRGLYNTLRTGQGSLSGVLGRV